MGIADILILSLLGGFLYYGFTSGLVKMLVNLVGAVFAIVVSLHTYYQTTYWILPENLADRFYVQVFVFFLILIVILKAMDFLADFVQKIFNIVSIIPFTKTLNRVFGAGVGLLEGVLFVAAVVFVIEHASNAPDWLVSGLDGSFFAYWIGVGASGLMFFFPDVVEKARGVVGIR